MDYRSQLPINLYRAQQTRELDRYAIHQLGIPGLLLMERAGTECFQHIKGKWPQTKKITVLSGSGNNGGDGYVIAALAKLEGMDVQVLQLSEKCKQKGDAAFCLQRAEKLGVDIFEVLNESELANFYDRLRSSDLLVDALLGTGARGAPKGVCAHATNAINQSKAAVFAVDTPSGLCVDTGWAPGDTVIADSTLTFITLKQGLLTGSAANYIGELYFHDLGVPAHTYNQQTPSAIRLDFVKLMKKLPTRAKTVHKGDCGHVLIIGGADGMSGAALMAARAAARVGAGLTTILSPSQDTATLAAIQPEIMCRRSNDVGVINSLIEQATTLVVGPGLGKSDWAKSALEAVLKAQKPTVIDADALNILSEQASTSIHGQCILTPHPKEASRLLSIPVEEIQQDRFKAAAKLADQFGGIALLKGWGTLISSSEEISVVSTGGSAMASGGMGDILSGLIGGFMAQGSTPLFSAQFAATIHGLAADHLAEKTGVRGVLATDLLPVIRKYMANFNSNGEQSFSK